jgi:glycogen(starch) synthase
MHIALLSRAVFGLHGYGGMERHVRELARFLARAGVQVTLVTMPPTVRQTASAADGSEWDEPDIELLFVTAPRLPLRGIADRVVNYPYWTRAAGAYLASRNFDLVHAQGLSGWGYARLLAQGVAHAPLLINPQGMEEFKTSTAKRLAYLPFHMFVRQAARQATALIAADSAAAREIPHFLHVRPERVVMIPNGIDVDAARCWVNPRTLQALTAQFQLAQRTPLLLSVGRLEANKGFDVLLAALSRIRPLFPSKWLWLLVGEGPQRGALEHRIRALRLDRHVQMPGALDDATLHNLYELATLFVHPTRFEGSSLVTLEAMAHGRAVVATAVGGIPDKVVHGRNGYLVTPGDPVELGDKILEALRDAPRLRAMGEASYEIARRSFDWPQTILQTLTLYERVTHKPTTQLHYLALDSDAPVPS